MKIFKTAIFSAVVLLGAWFALGDPKSSVHTASAPQSASQSQLASLPASMPASGVLTLDGMKIDVTNSTVTIDAKVCLRTGPLEFVLCTGSTKSHESLLTTKVLPSYVHAAMLAVGLTPGKPVKFIPGDETWPGKTIPPRGPGVTVTLNWKDADGKDVSADVTQWMTEDKGKEIKDVDRWVFVGSEMMPDGYYLADENGEVISCSNFATSVIDVPFESSADNNDRMFVANTKAIPAIGTDVSVVIKPVAGSKDSPDARLCLDIDRFGRMLADGKAVEMDKLTDWAYEYIKKHERGQVVIRIDGNARVWLMEQAKEKLMIGGVRDFDYRYFPPGYDLLPMTTSQVAVAMTMWQDRFKNPQDYILKPDDLSEMVLWQIDDELEIADRTKKIWKTYREELQAQRIKYMATTQQAAESQPAPAE